MKDEKTRLLEDDYGIYEEDDYEEEVGGDGMGPTFCKMSWLLHFRVLMTYLACVLAAGTLSGYPTIEPILVNNEIFAELCYDRGLPLGCEDQMKQLGTLYTISLGCSVSAMFIAGLFYDKMGPKNIAIFGAVGAACGFVMIWASLLRFELHWMIYIALPLTDTMGFFNSFALMGFLWHYPRYQGTIMGISNSSYQISAIMSLVVVAMTEAGLAFSSVCLIFAGLCLISAALSFSAPSLYEFHTEAKKMLGAPIVYEPIHVSLKSSLVVMAKKPLENLIFMSYCLTNYIAVVYYVSQYDLMTTVMFDEDTSAMLANIFAIVYVILGCALSPFLGRLMDFTGFKLFLVLLQISTVAFVSTMFIRNVVVNLIAVGLAIIYLSAFMTFVVKWAVIYAPAELLGTYFGIMFGLIGIIQLVFNSFVMPAIVAKYWPGPVLPLASFYWVDGILFGAGIASGVSLSVLLFIRGIPTTPPTRD